MKLYVCLIGNDFWMIELLYESFCIKKEINKNGELNGKESTERLT